MGIDYNTALKNFNKLADKRNTPKEADKDSLLSQFHPDHGAENFTKLKIGTNKGMKCHKTLAALLQADPRIDEADLAGVRQFETDVLILGGGGAGCAAALTAMKSGARVTLATKLKIGDSNTVMAEGGMQASIEKDDTPQTHYDDTFKAGHEKGEKELIKQLVLDGPDSVRWLVSQGMQFDTDKYGNLMTRKAGGTSSPRVVYFKDYTGLEMMRTLREAVLNEGAIKILDYHPAVELLSNEDGECQGAVLKNIESGKLLIVRAKAVIMATGGLGRLHLNDFPTSNHFGATADGLVLCYRMGAKLTDVDSFQYHPTGLAYPHHLRGYLITEGIRSAGSKLINGKGQRFVDELLARDIVTAAILKECAEGRAIDIDGVQGVFLDTPALEKETPGILENKFPKLLHLGAQSGKDPKTEPSLIYPTLHYQNGGVKIDKECRTTVSGLYCAGEVSGGIHGKNRLMGNALLEIISFGRRAGLSAAQHITTSTYKKVTIGHLTELRRELATAKMPMTEKSPLLFPKGANYKI